MDAQTFARTGTVDRRASSTPAGEPLQASYLAHELRAPLTSINLTLEILREQLEGRLQSDEKQLMSIAIKNTERLAGLINDIMDFAKIRSGKIGLLAKPARPVSLIGEALESLKVLALSKGVRLFSSCAGKFLPDIQADSKRVVQVLINLLSNALKFTSNGGQVEVSADLVRYGPEGMVVFSVKDTGCGIPRKDYERVFACFEQSSAGVKTGKGTGLGLTLAKAMVELHGGRIWVESVLGAGTTFFFSIPVSSEAPVEAIQ